MTKQWLGSLVVAFVLVANSAWAQPWASPRTGCVVVENLAAADDNLPVWSPLVPVTLKSGWCTCLGTCTTPATILFEDGAGNATTGTLTCGTAAAPGSVAPITAGGSLTAREVLALDVTNAVSPETDEYVICWMYRTDW